MSSGNVKLFLTTGAPKGLRMAEISNWCGKELAALRILQRNELSRSGVYVLLMILSGCAVSSGVSKTGPDSYTITTSASPARGGVPAAKAAAYQEANSECHRQHREFVLVAERLSAPTWTEGMAIATLEFKCAART